MAQRNIDFGTFPDDPDADAIRTAFQKTQENFTEIFTGLQDQAVISIREGAGITVNSPTGNVVVSANIACVAVRSTSLYLGIGGSGTGPLPSAQTLTSSSQTLYIDLPTTVNTITTLNLANSLTANTVNVNLTLNGNVASFTGNISSGGNLSAGNATITGNVNAGNINAGIGNFSGNINSLNANLGNVANANNLSVASNANITGNLTAGNIDGGNLIVANYFQGDGGNISNVSASNVRLIEWGNTSVEITASNSSIFMDVAGTANVMVVNQTGVNVSGYLTTTGDLTAANANLGNAVNANYFIGTFYGTANSATTATTATTAGTVTTNAQPNITSVGTLSSLTVTNKVTAGQLQGDGGNISNIQGANVSGAVASATTATTATSATTATTAGTVTTAAQPNITSVGTLTGLGVNGNIIGGNITANTGIFTGNASGLTNIPGANVTGTVANATYALDAGNATNATSATSATTAGTVTTNAQPNITSVGTLSSVSVTGNVTAGNVYSNSGTIGASLLTGTLTTSSQPNITSVGTLGSLTVTNKVTAGQLQGDGGNISNVQGSNVSGTVANATYATSAGSAGSATTAGTVTTNAQPNITSVGTLSSVAVTGNITAGNVYANSGTIGAQTLKGEGGNISNIQGANVSGTVSSATTAGTVTTNAQPNITSVGTLSSAAVTGNITAGNVYANSGTIGASLLTGTLTTAAQPNITSVGTLSSLSITGNLSSGNANLGNLAKANFFQGDGSLLTNISVGAGSYIENGNSEVRVDANSDVRFTIAGNANVVTVTGTGVNVAGNVSATLFTGTLATASQPNVTSLGTLTALNVNGVANLGAVGNVRISGGSNNQVLVATGTGANVAFVTASGLTFAPGSNTEVLFNDAGSFQANANLTFNKTTGTLSTQALSVTNSGVFGNVFANSGTVRGNLLTGTLTTAAQPNITSVGSLTSLIVSGNINAGNVSGGNLVTANYLTGTLTTAAQPNITSVGTLTSLGVNGTVTAVNLTANTGVITGNGNGISSIVGANVTGTVANATYATSAGTATTAGTVTTAAQPNITSVGALTAVTVTGTASLGRTTVAGGTQTSNNHALAITQTWNNSSVQFSSIEANITDTASAANSSLINLMVAGSSKFSVSKEGNIFYSGVITGNGSGLSAIAGANVTGTVPSATSATTAGTVTTAAQPNITSVGTLTSLGVNGTITGTRLISNIATGTAPLTVTSTTRVANLNVANAGFADAATNAAAVLSNTSTNTTVYLTGTSTSANGNVALEKVTGIYANMGNNAITATTFVGALSGAATTAGTVTTNAQPNITSVGTLSSLSVTGNITGGNLIGPHANGNSNVNIPAANGNVNISAAGNANIAVVTGTGVNVAGTLNATGSLTTGGELSVTGNATITGNLYVNGNLTYLNTETVAVEDPIIQLQTGANGAAPTSNSGKDVGSALNYYDTQARTAFMGWDVSNVEFGLASIASITNEVVTFTTYGNLRVGNIIGNGQALTGITGANVTGTVANATFATSAGSATTAGTVTTNAQPNITSVGTLSSLAVTANVTAGNVYANSGTIGALTLKGEGGNISNIQGANVSGAVATATSATNASAVLSNNRSTGLYYPAFISSTANGNYALNTNASFSANIANGQLFATTFSGSLFTMGGNYTIDIDSNAITGYSYSNTGPYTITLTRSRDDSLPVQTNDSMGMINFSGSTLSATTTSARIQALTESNPGIDDQNPATALTFGTAAANAGFVSERVRITSTGNVGIGNSAPTHKLSVTGTLNVSGNANVGNIGAAAGVFTGNVSGANLTSTGYVIRSVNAAVSAAGTVQANATAITKEINVVSTVASGAGVVLPTAVAGMVITITNTSANSLLVYPATNGIINSQSANAAYTQPAGATLQYVAPTTTQWYTVGATFA